jgi:hypothetical protein
VCRVPVIYKDEDSKMLFRVDGESFFSADDYGVIQLLCPTRSWRQETKDLWRNRGRRVPHREHEARSAAQHLFRDAPHQQTLQSREAVCTHNDEIDMVFHGRTENDLSGIAFLKAMFDADSRAWRLQLLEHMPQTVRVILATRYDLTMRAGWRLNVENNQFGAVVARQGYRQWKRRGRRVREIGRVKNRANVQHVVAPAPLLLVSSTRSREKRLRSRQVTS